MGGPGSNGEAGQVRLPKAIAWGAAAAAVGAGAAVALGRWVAHEVRLRPDPYADEPYGSLRGDRSYRVTSFDGTQIHVEEFGPPEAASGAIFAHGYGLNCSVWHHQMTVFDDGRRYLYFDARHHGRSNGAEGTPIDTTAMARDLQAVLEQSGLAGAVLIGQSMGGMTVLEFCRQHPEELGTRVRGLVLVNTTDTDVLSTFFLGRMLGTVERTRRAVDWLMADPRRHRGFKLRNGDFSRLLVARSGFGPGAPPSQIDYIRHLLSAFPNPALIETLRNLLTFDMAEDVRRISVPTLVVAGTDDQIIAPVASARLAEKIPGARLVVFERSGHVGFMERHEEFNALVGQFIDEVLGEGAVAEGTHGA